MTAALAFVPIIAFAACGRDRSKEVNAGASTAPRVMMIHASDFAYAMPDTVTAGVVTLKLVNDGPGLHHVQLVRLDSGRTLADLVAALRNPGPPPAWAAFITGPNAPTTGRESNVTVDLAAGHYAVLCLVDVPGGIPHFAKGMTHALTVTSAAAGAAVVALPTPDITITLADYSFTLSQPITSGTHTFEVKTMPGQPHEVELIKLVAGKTPADVFAWMEKMEGPPPIEHALGGVSATPTGIATRFTADFTPGDYMIVCFVPDAKDGKTHAMKGMVKTFKIA